ncbi:MAG: RNA-binding protein [Candidatus Altiarchaeales archaeon]|nr:RNA-binding protein [Candidatus Altiarchaeales archaeon]MBD3417350.1 RNA-binding protein [Candidatus Altiarchaeales archaeon]
MDDKVMVGDYLGTIEEFTPGEGTYAEEGKIYAAKVGFKAIDSKRHVAEVKGKGLPALAVGQTVFGQVMGFRTSMVTVIVSKIAGQKGNIDERTAIYVSNIDDSYVEKPEDLFGIGDIVKATVVKMDGNVIDISTKGDYGVVKAFCKRCRKEMEKSDKGKDKLKCPSCGHIEKRKIAKDYGKVSDF